MPTAYIGWDALDYKMISGEHSLQCMHYNSINDLSTGRWAIIILKVPIDRGESCTIPFWWNILWLFDLRVNQMCQQFNLKSEMLATEHEQNFNIIHGLNLTHVPLHFRPYNYAAQSLPHPWCLQSSLSKLCSLNAEPQGWQILCQWSLMSEIYAV